MAKQLIEHIDFYYNEDGYMVLTERLLLERGYCCGNGCRHCPYNHINVPPVEKKQLKDRTYGAAAIKKSRA